MADASIQVNATARLGRLDGLRGIAAATVAFAYHPRDLFVGALASGIAPFDWLHDFGWLFVDLFFLLSGYIFAHVYLGRPRAFGPGDVADFAVARFARLYPLHLVMLLASAALFWRLPENTLIAFCGHLLMLQALVEPVARTFVGPSWSLSIEALCYVLFALGAAAGPAALRRTTMIAIGAGLVLLLLHHAPDGPDAHDNLARGLLGFFLGQVLWHRRAWLARVPAAAVLATMVAGLAIPPAWIGPILPCVLLVFPGALVMGLRLAWLESRPLIWLGDRSYAIYLIHLPVMQVYVDAYGRVPGTPAGILVGHAVFIGVVLILSDLALRLIERPAREAIRRGWAARRAAAPAIA